MAASCRATAHAKPPAKASASAGSLHDRPAARAHSMYCSCIRSSIGAHLLSQPQYKRQYRGVDRECQQAEARYAFHDPHSIPSLQSAGGCAMIQVSHPWVVVYRLFSSTLWSVDGEKGFLFCPNSSRHRRSRRAAVTSRSSSRVCIPLKVVSLLILLLASFSRCVSVPALPGCHLYDRLDIRQQRCNDAPSHIRALQI